MILLIIWLSVFILIVNVHILHSLKLNTIKLFNRCQISLSAKRRSNIRKITQVAPPPEDFPKLSLDTIVFSKKGSDIVNPQKESIGPDNLSSSLSPKILQRPEVNSLNQQLQSDLIGFKSINTDETADSKSNSVVQTLKSVFSSILIADFFVIIFFLLWFLLAAALQSTYPVVLERFQDIFQPVVVPSLTVLMVGSIASGVLGDNDNKKKQIG